MTQPYLSVSGNSSTPLKAVFISSSETDYSLIRLLFEPNDCKSQTCYIVLVLGVGQTPIPHAFLVRQKARTMVPDPADIHLR